MADVSVRIAWADDARAIATLQSRVWAMEYGEAFGDLAQLDPEQTAASWHASLSRSTDARNRVLVALEGNRVVGFAVTIPAADPDCDPVSVGEVVEFVIDPGEQNLGHGSRLLQAIVDTLIADNFTRAVCWVAATDDQRRGFFADAGWATDGAHRELDLDGTGSLTLKQVRLHTAIA
jgi:GNAT superfamily N-acetyltransferase